MDEINRNYERSPRSNRNPERTSKRRRKSGIGKKILKVLGTLALIGITTGALLACFGAVYIKTVIMPQTDLDLNDLILNENSVMYYQDRETGEYKELCTVANTTSSIPVTFDEIPDDLINATVAIEDKRFWDHHGVDWLRTGRAILNMFTGQDIQGGSTLTQQLIKNWTQYDDVTVKRKVIEIFKALELDKNYSKEDIITAYLNIIYLGSGCEGVGAAAYEYFGKPVSELDLAECASLISITNNPSIYSPYSGYKYVDEETGETVTAVELNKRRQELVLDLMCEQGKISEEERDAAKAEELVFDRQPGEADPVDIYSWYEEKVLDDVRDDLMALGYTQKAANMLLSSGGLKIYTCVDPEIQAAAEAVYEDRSNLDYTSKSGQEMQSAITIVDNSNGDVVAIVGQMGEKEGNRIWSMAVDTKRQPGSSIKPLSAYAPALEMGYITPGSVVDDYPYQVLGGKVWPVNSGAARYKGLTTIYNALTNSINTIAVRLVGDYVGVEASYKFLEEHFHITSLVDHMETSSGEIKNDYGLAQLALGGLTTGVNTFEMAAAYATFPNNGIYNNPRTYTRVEDMDGKVILDNEKENDVVLKESTAFYINYMLKNVVANGTGTRARFNGMTIAGKTGTTSDDNDRWFVGYTPYYTAAVWTGYKQPEKIRSQTNPAVIMWRLVMEQIHEGLENRDFDQPENVVTSQYCLDSGGIPTEECKNDPRGSRATSGYFIRNEIVPTEYCTIHTAVQVCTDCPILNEDGTETGLYHLAGEFCPEESIITVSLLNYERESVGGAVAEDNIYLLSYTEAAGPCTTHTEVTPPAYDPSTFNPLDPNTWPTDPGFNIFDETTWPNYRPDGGQDPEPTPSETPVTSPEPTPTESGEGDAEPTGSP